MTKNIVLSDMNNKVYHSHDNNLETFSLVWLDTQVNTTGDNRQTQLKLQQIINYLTTFDDIQLCQQYIMSLSAHDRLILIVSGRLGSQLVPQIHHLQQLSSIYVYCMDQRENRKWSKKFTKVKKVIVRVDDLIHQIKADQKVRIKLEEPLSIKIYNDNSTSDQSTTELNGDFVHSLLLIDVLLRMKSEEADKQQLIALCKDNYKNSDRNLRIVAEFERKYTSNKALWWYTRECFLYRMLNKALRVQNIDLLFLFRFVIAHMYQQLKENQCQSYVRVYRAQVISNDELDRLRRSIGKCLSINSFFSTTVHRRTAWFNLGSSSSSIDWNRVLFIIDADPRVVTSKPFANISALSDFTNESEVLFMTGCIFRLTDIYYDNVKQIWKIRMELCGDDEHDLKKLFNHMKREYGCGENEVNLQSFGDVLHRMGQYDLAEKIYYRVYAKLPENDPSISHLCYSLGMLSKDRKEYDYSLQWFHKSLEIKMLTDPSNYIYISGLYGCIGNVHMKKGNDNEAMGCYQKAIEGYKAADAANHPHMAAWYHGIADIYLYQKKYFEALKFYEQSLSTQKKCLPFDHFDMATNYNDIGVVYRHLNLYEHAMDHHRQSLAIRMKSLPSQHPDIGLSYKNIGLVYEAKNKWKRALKYYQKAAIIYRHSLSTQHPDVIEIEKDIQHCYEQAKRPVNTMEH